MNDGGGRSLDDQAFLSPVEELIDNARNGHMFVLVDDENRENEGDLVIPAQMATPEAINFMVKHGRGLVCLALSGERVKELGLRPMDRRNTSQHDTAFTVSIEAKEGVTTGISAADRAQTIRVAIDPRRTGDDITTPGHVFPLLARDGGVLVRAGHTEAAVDLARLAGLNPAGVICEIMNDDGSMARLPDLVAFCQHHGLRMGSIADLIAYRRRHDNLVERLTETDVDTGPGGRFHMIVYVNKAEYAEHVALVKGDLTEPGPVLVRVHAVNLLTDVLADRNDPKSGDLANSLAMIDKAGRGAAVLIRDTAPTSLSTKVQIRAGLRPGDAYLRDYGVGAQILLDLGVREMILLTNTTRTIVGLDGFGLTLVARKKIEKNG